MSVPKIIHYCWFGKGDLSPTAHKVLASWKKYAPGFEIKRCDEDTFDPESVPWTRDAYAAKKYAFVADYARFRMLYDYGGVYMDLGSELIKPIGSFVERHTPFSVIEGLSKTATTGLCAATQPHDPVVASVLAHYERLSFLDDIEFLRAHTVNEMFTQELEKIGFIREDCLQKVGEWTLFPSETFNPVYGFGGYHIKRETYSVHHYSASWENAALRRKRQIVTRLAPFIGRRPAQIIGRVIGEVCCGDISNLKELIKKSLKGGHL